MTIKEFKAKFESEAAFRAKFADVKTEDEFVKVAKAEGYDFEQLSEEDLDAVAGGNLWDMLRYALEYAKHAFRPPKPDPENKSNYSI